MSKVIELRYHSSDGKLEDNAIYEEIRHFMIELMMKYPEWKSTFNTHHDKNGVGRTANYEKEENA